MLHIQEYHIVPVQMRREGRDALYLQPCKHLLGIAATAIIGCQHPERHGLAKTPGPADTEKLLFRADIPVRMLDQSCLVHIDLRPQCLRKAFVSRIQIDSHIIPAFLQNRGNIPAHRKYPGNLPWEPVPDTFPAVPSPAPGTFHKTGQRDCGPAGRS